MNGLPSPVSLNPDYRHWFEGDWGKEGSTKTGGGRRESLLLDLEQDGRVELAARRE